MAQITLNSSGVASNGTLALQSNGTTTAVTIDTSQNVGIGTSSPVSKLHIGGNAAGASQAILTSGVSDPNFQLWVTNGATGATSGTNQASIGLAYSGVGFGSKINFLRGGGTTDGTIAFETQGSERMRIDSSGNVGIGTSSPTGLLDVYKAAQGGTNTFRAYGPAGQILWANGGASTSYLDSDTTIFRQSSASGNTERMRLDSSGNLLVGTTSSAARITAKAATSDNSGYVTYMDDSAGTLMFYVRNDGVFLTGGKAASPYNNNVGAVRTLMVTSSGVLGYNASTRNTKTNIAPLTNVNWLFNLEPVSFNYREKDDDNNYTDVAKADVHYGLIAEDAENVNKDLCFYNSDGSLAGVNYDLLSPALLKAVQDMKAIIDTQASTITQLQADVAALKGTA